jgi:hypothetical protein
MSLFQASLLFFLFSSFFTPTVTHIPHLVSIYLVPITSFLIWSFSNNRKQVCFLLFEKNARAHPLRADWRAVFLNIIE